MDHTLTTTNVSKSIQSINSFKSLVAKTVHPNKIFARPRWRGVTELRGWKVGVLRGWGDVTSKFIFENKIKESPLFETVTSK